jgi:hypothetical protein
MCCVIIAEIFTAWAPINVKLFSSGPCLLANGISCPLFLSFLFDCFVQDAKCSGVICAERRWGLDVAQFSECYSEWGAALGVFKARFYFLFSRGGDHIFNDGSHIKDGSIQIIFLWGFVATEKQAS